MKQIQIYNRIPEIADAVITGVLSEEQEQVRSLIMEDELCTQEYEQYLQLYSKMHAFGQRSRVKGMLMRLKDQHATIWSRMSSYISNHKAIFDLVTKAAAVIVFALASFTFINSKFENNQKQITYLSRKINQIDDKQRQQATELKASGNLPINPGDYSGTAFAISDNGLFLTAAHLVDHVDSVYVFMGNQEAYRASVLELDLVKDIAILKLEDHNFKIHEPFPYRINTQEVGLSSDVYTLSFSKNDKVYNRGYISSLTGLDGDSVFYQLYLPASNGSSGSPVIDNKNNIVGFISNKNSSESEVTYAVKMKEVQDLIKGNTDIENGTIFKLNSKSKKSDLKTEISNLNNFIVNVRAYKKG